MEIHFLHIIVNIVFKIFVPIKKTMTIFILNGVRQSRHYKWKVPIK